MSTSARALLRNSYDQVMATIDRGEGVFVWDTDGVRYLDASSGAVVTSLGHSDPVVVSAMRTQLERVTYTHRGAFTSEAAEQAAELLAQITGYPSVWLVNSGSEAVEAAINFALQYWHERGEPERDQFLSHAQSYHGSTMGALSLSGHARRENAESLLHPFNQLVPPSAIHHAGERDEATFVAHLLDTAREHIERVGDRLAGVVVEPIGGATAGATVPPEGYLKGLADLCLEYGVLLIADEVMTALGRCGKPLACDHFGVRPDLVAIGKGLGGGYTPIAAVLVSDRINEAIAEGSRTIKHGHTYAGNPLSAVAAHAVLQRTNDLDLIPRALELGATLGQRLHDLAADHPMVAEARGLGMLHGLELTDDPATGRVSTPPGQLASQVVAAAMKQGLLLYPATGEVNDAVIVAPPLTISREEIDMLVGALDRTLTAVEADLDLIADGRAAAPTGAST